MEGDIIISNNTITPEIMQKIATEVEKLIQTNAKDPGEWESVSSLQGITSLPVFQVMGTTYKLVRVAVDVLKGVDGQEVELQVNQERTYIQWRYTDGMWDNLIEIALLKGDPGDTPEFRKGDTGIEWKYTNADDWQTLVSIDDLRFHFEDLTVYQLADLWREVPDDVVALFQAPATEAAETANAAASAANQAAQAANQAKADADEATEAAEAATSEAQAATTAATTAAGNTNKAIQDAEAATSAANAAAQAANQAKADADEATEAAQTATSEAQAATQAAQQAKQDAETATSAAETATDAANDAASAATTAAGNTNTAIQNAETATDAANAAALAANQAKADADEATEAAETATSAANAATSAANSAAQAANQAKAGADAATEAAEAATTEANAATALATELNSHPMKPQGGYWFKWNPATDAYENTGIQAKGDVGASFKIVGHYDSEAALKQAIPDGSDIDGVYAVGAAEPYSYYAWVVVDGTYQWQNQGQLRGAEGKSAYEVWMDDPSNEGKDTDDFFAWLSPVIDPETGNWSVQGHDTGLRARAVDAQVTEKTNDGETYVLHVKSAAGEFDTPNLHGTSSRITEHAGNSEKVYQLDITDGSGTYTTPNLRGLDGEKYTVPTLDHEPGETDLAWSDGGISRDFEIGYMCRWFDPDYGEEGDYLFFQLKDITAEGKAVWQRAGSGGGDSESVTVSLTTDGDAADLEGCTVLISYGITSAQLPWTGEPLAFSVPANAEYTISAAAVAGYVTPAPQTFVAEPGGVREVTVHFALIHVSTLTFDPANQAAANLSGDIDKDVFRRLAEGARRCLAKREANGGVAICYLHPQTSMQYDDGTEGATDGTEGDVMVHLPAAWVSVELQDDGLLAVSVSDIQQAGWQPLPECLVGAMKGYVSDGKLYSRAQVVPAVGLSFNQALAAAEARGEGFGLTDYRAHCLVALLLYARYGTRAITSVVGSCLPYDASRQTGTTLTLGNRDTAAADNPPFASCLGLEGWTGATQEWLDGITLLNKKWRIREGNNLREVDGLGSTGWVTAMAMDGGALFDLVPTGSDSWGSATNGWTEFCEVVAAPFIEMAVARANFTYDGATQDDGVARLSATLPPFQPGPYCGARLAYRGTIRVVEDPAEFKALPIL